MHTTHTFRTQKAIAAFVTLFVALAGVPFVSNANVSDVSEDMCKTKTFTIASSSTTRVVGNGVAIVVKPSTAWTAAIAGSTTWIWQAGPTLPDRVVAFEKSFTVMGTVRSAQLDIATNNDYKVFIDGVEVAADPAATSATLATQDSHTLTAAVTPGVHTLRIEVAATGSFSALNPEGLLYKFKIDTCFSPASPEVGVRVEGVTVISRNRGTMATETFAFSSTGRNSARGSVGGAAHTGGDVAVTADSPLADSTPSSSLEHTRQPHAGSNSGVPSGSLVSSGGGASAGAGAGAGASGRGGRITTGRAVSNAITTNDLNITRVRTGR